MTSEERRAWIRMLAVLAVAAVVRATWERRAVVPAPGVERDVAAAVDTVSALRAEADRRATPLGADERIDPNRADAVELDRLPGVGPATARAIVAARVEAPFRTAADLARVPGIGPSTIEKIAPHLTLPPARTTLSPARAPRPASRATARSTTPPPARSPTRAPARSPLAERPAAAPTATRIDVNRADRETLQTLPGIGPALSERIVQDRARNGPFARVDDLMRVPGIGPATLERLRPLVETR